MTHTGTAADDPTANPTTTGDTVAAPLTRRAAREAAERAARRPLARTASAPTAPRTSAARPAAARTPATRAAATRDGRALGVTRAAAPSASSRKRRFMAPVVLAVAAGMFGTMAVPAAFATTSTSQAGAAQTDAASDLAVQAQQFDVSAAAGAADTSRDGFSATSTATLEAQAAAKAAAKAAAELEAARAAKAAEYAYDGKTAEDYLADDSTGAATTASAADAANAAATSAAPAAGTPFSLPAVVATAKQYIGTPYVFGGATPAGFDCSGYVMYVYAQHGISLAHSVTLQDQAGTTIPESEAQPGDVVVFNDDSHDGFYMGNGMIMDAPKPGGSVSIRPIWSSNYHIVRFGI
ncbi:C40 family peptidase [Curtobacterium sp. MCPF17_050]|uniref:C40 family peptidase n=1 Tax=Curtobacterium sp. MCPF17_050 TaxID=2175664 RepID=UPI000D906CCC|nr:C40 family peptidase [Curtobacterium sp. MCPF17_050]WIB15137.1 C40 family peptidase [Curtobacterium sp. MCPF17_050]